MRSSHIARGWARCRFGVRRDDVRPGLRITNYKKRVAIAFDVDDARVHIIGNFYGGQDYDSVLIEEE
jgi:toxin ParE1/3/4